MGSATIDPHSLKRHTEIYKMPKFGVKIVSKIQPFKNVIIYKEMYGLPDSCPAASSRPYISL